MKENTQRKQEDKINQIQKEIKLLKETKKNNQEYIKYIKNEELAYNKTKHEFIKSQKYIQIEKKRGRDV
jgi:hypothetical protein